MTLNDESLRRRDADRRNRIVGEPQQVRGRRSRGLAADRATEGTPVADHRMIVLHRLLEPWYGRLASSCRERQVQNLLVGEVLALHIFIDRALG